jgi:ribosomal protein S18 acetylase RimI-like enzyme
MAVSLIRLTESNIKDAGRCDGTFDIEGEIVLHVTNGEIRYEVVNRPSTTKQYSAVINYQPYINNPDKAVYFAYIDKKVAGEVVLEKHWNNYGFVFYIVVDIDFRGQGIGRVLMEKAKDWARGMELAGLMVETQTNNVGACRFYEICGFVLGGFDKYLYQGDDKHSDETALFWYYHFHDVGD